MQKGLLLTTYRRAIYDWRKLQFRNQFPGKGKLKIPIIPKFQEKAGDFDDLLLIGFDKTHLEDQNHLDRMVHFFLYDYRFERVWKNPDNDIEKLSRYLAVLSPDFSMYLEMAPVMQLSWLEKVEEAPTAGKSNRQNQRMSDSGERRVKQNIPIQQKVNLLKRWLVLTKKHIGKFTIQIMVSPNITKFHTNIVPTKFWSIWLVVIVCAMWSRK